MNRRRYSSLRWMASLALASACLIGLAGPALALDRSQYSMEILVDGIPLNEFQARDTTYIQALEDREYSIRLTNHTGRRIAVAVSVDGLNSIDAKATSAHEASKWILGPFDSITLDGWQTSSNTARRFFFTSEEQSYGAWLGKTANLGVISAAIFLEKPKPVMAPSPMPAPRRKSLNRSSGSIRSGRAGLDAPAAGEAESQFDSLSDDMAATGIGRELDHQVRRVRFEADNDPVTSLSIRYEYRDALIALGVLPHHPPRRSALSRRERSRGFSDDNFAPDPFR